MEEKLIKMVSKDNHFRAFFVDATQLVNQATKNHHTSRIASNVLGRALVGTLLTANAVVKGDELFHVQFNGRGPIGNVMTEADAKGMVRGYVTNESLEDIYTENGQLDVGKAVGINGTMQISKIQPYQKEPFVGLIQMVSGEIGDEFTYYLAQSEQIKSVVAVSVYLDKEGDVVSAGGFLVQRLPDAKEKDVKQLENRLKKIPALSTMLLEGLNPKQIVGLLFGGEETVMEVGVLPVYLAPAPEKEIYHEMLLTLPPDEIQAMIDEDGGAEISERFSAKKYFFSPQELTDILEEIKSK